MEVIELSYYEKSIDSCDRGIKLTDPSVFFYLLMKLVQQSFSLDGKSVWLNKLSWDQKLPLGYRGTHSILGQGGNCTIGEQNKRTEIWGQNESTNGGNERLLKFISPLKFKYLEK